MSSEFIHAKEDRGGRGRASLGEHHHAILTRITACQLMTRVFVLTAEARAQRG